jgi:DNA-binding MarR family transcriptional regulator/N-acetylglutamate synthase-like GNAT family acetyltransferase
MAVSASGIMDSQVAALRRFNRFYTREIGTLREGLLGSDYSLAEARVLYELATRGECIAGDIARDLALDAGYLSRILRKFKNSGLLHSKVSRGDARQSTLTLTKRGKEVFADLNERSSLQARGVLERVSPARLPELLNAMRTIEETLGDLSSDAPYVLRGHRPGDMGWIVSREGIAYVQEYGWDETFEALVARIVGNFLENYDAGRDRCWIAERDGVPLGHVFLVHHPEEADTAKLRLLLVERAARGLGLGKALVGECVRFARSAGYRKVTLWTQSILYRQAGSELVREVPHHSFGKDLIGQTWELML